MTPITLTIIVSTSMAAIGLSLQTQSVTCMQQLKSLGKASLLYAESNDGFLPPQVTFEFQPRGARDETAAWKKNLIASGAKDANFRCPSDDRFDDDDRRGIFGKPLSHGTSYGVTLAMMDQPNLEGGLKLSLKRLEKPEKTAYLEDVLYIAPQDDETGRIVSSHGSSLNRWFLDGHVGRSPTTKKKT